MAMRAVIAGLGGVLIGGLLALGAAATIDEGGSGSEAREDDAIGGMAPTSTSVDGRDGDVLVFLDRGVTDSQRQSIEASLDNHPEVASYEYWDHAESVAEARRLFSDNAEMLAKIDKDPDLIPASYRVILTSAGLGSAGRIAADVEDRPGVLEAVASASGSG
jgi:FtsX extracellular domain